MSNKIKFTTDIVEKSISKGNLRIATDSNYSGPTNKTGFFAGITPPINGYTIYIKKTGGIVEDGLVFAIDAGHPSSYRHSLGLNKVWDISGNGNDVDLINGVNYSTDNGGSFVFDGINDWISMQTYTFGNGNWTVNIWMKTNNSSSFNILSNSSGGPVTNAFGIYNNKIHYRNHYIIWNEHNGNTTINISTWYMLTWVNYDNKTMQMYINGEPDSSIFNSQTGNGGPCNAIGRNWYNYFNGNISQILFYNRSLSQEEILQNYNFEKNKYI